MRSIAVLVSLLALVGAPQAAADTPPDVQRVANVVTVQTSAAHNLQAGDTVTIAGVTNPPDACGDAVAGTSFNGTVTVASVPSATSFTYAQSGPDEIGQGGTATGPVITKSITGAQRSSNVVTITTSSAHGFITGQTVTVAGVDVSSFNGTFTISAAPTSTVFTYAQNGGPESGTGGTATTQGSTKSIGSGDTTGPADPGALSATSADSTAGGIAYDSDGSFGVEWGASSDGGSGVGIYCVERSASASGPFDLLAFVAHPTTSVAQSGLAEGSYFYRVRTRDNVGNLSSFTGPFQVVVDFPDAQTPSPNPLTPGPVPGTAPLPDTVAPRVTLPLRRLRATRSGYIRLPIVCPKTEPKPCKGTVAIARTVAKTSFTISPGATKRVRMRLTRSARRAIARSGRIRVDAIVVVTDEAGNTRRIRVPLTILRAS